MFNLEQLTRDGHIILVADYLAKYKGNNSIEIPELANGVWDPTHYATPHHSYYAVSSSQFWPYHSILVDQYPTLSTPNSQSTTHRLARPSNRSPFDLQVQLVYDILTTYFEASNWKSASERHSSFVMPLSKVYAALPDHIRQVLAKTRLATEKETGRVGKTEEQIQIELVRQWLQALLEEGPFESEWLIVSSFALQRVLSSYYRARQRLSRTNMRCICAKRDRVQGEAGRRG